MTTNETHTAEETFEATTDDTEYAEPEVDAAEEDLDEEQKRNLDQIEAILADPSAAFELESGFEVRTERIRLRQLLRFLKILTTNATDILSAIRVDSEDDSNGFIGTLLMALAISIPDSENEIVEFVQSLVKPAGLVEGRDLPPAVKKENDKLRDELYAELSNPSPDDVFEILSRVLIVEGPNLLNLVQKLQFMIRTGAI